jgi:hypothetical protein
VFAIFATLSFLEFKELGVGLATAILIDATIIRGVLLPATMKLLGERNWYLPRWLEWLPKVGLEGAAPVPAGRVRSNGRYADKSANSAEGEGARRNGQGRGRPTAPAAEEGSRA